MSTPQQQGYPPQQDAGQPPGWVPPPGYRTWPLPPVAAIIVPATEVEQAYPDNTGELSLALPLSSTSQALEASRVVKSGSGVLWGFSGISNAGGSQFVQAFDARELPADGAIPIIVVGVGPGGNFSYDGGTMGRPFREGIILCCSSTLATKTIAAASCWFDAQYN